MRHHGCNNETALVTMGIFFVFGAIVPSGPGPPLSWGFLDHTQWRTTVGRTHLVEWSARRRNVYLTTHKTHNRQISMPRWESNPQFQQAGGRRPTF